MELLQLNYFCDAAITQNFSKTAEKYNVPPSNISQSIKRLETELSVSLFDRHANRVVLNERGQAFFETVQQALSLLESARTMVTDHQSVRQLRLVIHVNRRIVMQAIERYQSNHPEINILTTHDLSEAPHADLVISANTLDLHGFTRELLFSERIVLATKKGLLPNAPLTARDLQHKPFITMSAGNSLHTLTEEICRKLGFQPRIALQSDDPFYIRKCVELGLGLAFVPMVSWKGQFSDDVTFHNLGDHTRDVFLYRKMHCTNHQALDNFCGVLLKEIHNESADIQQLSV